MWLRKKNIIDLDNGLVPIRRQSVIETDDDSTYICGTRDRWVNISISMQIRDIVLIIIDCSRSTAQIRKKIVNERGY